MHADIVISRRKERGPQTWENGLGQIQGLWLGSALRGRVLVFAGLVEGLLGHAQLQHLLKRTVTFLSVCFVGRDVRHCGG